MFGRVIFPEPELRNANFRFLKAERELTKNFLMILLLYKNKKFNNR